MSNKIDKALKVLKKIEMHGYEAYIVGGAVRNIINNCEINDIDIATNAKIEEVEKIFNQTIVKYLEYQTITIKYDLEIYEITSFRIEERYIKNRKPQNVRQTSSINIDVSRRDFTINGLYLDSNMKIIDLVDGIADINKKIIRSIGYPELRFNEDALRILRAIRFCSEYGFSIESETLKGMKSNSLLLTNVSAERIKVELKKILLGKYKTKALEYYKQCDFGGNLVLKSSEVKVENAYSLELCLVLIFDIDSIREMKFSKRIVKKCQMINEILSYKSYQELFDYEYDLIIECSKHLGDNILNDYNRLVIKSNDEVDFDMRKLQTVFNIQPSKVYQEILNKIIDLINTNQLDNQEEKIINYLKKDYDFV